MTGTTLRNQMRWPASSSPDSGSDTSSRLMRPPGRTMRPNSAKTAPSSVKLRRA